MATDQALDLDNYIAATLALQQIPVEQAWQEAIRQHFVNAQRLAEIVAAAPIDPSTLELANTFTPGKPSR